MTSATRIASPLLLLLLVTGVVAQPAAAQTPTSSPPMQSPAAPAGSTSPQTTPELPSNLAKIKDGVLAPNALNLDDTQGLRFYVNTVAPFPKFTDIVGNFNLRTGPVPYAGMTHNEFVQSTRPKDMYSSAGFTVTDVMKFALLSYTEGKAFELLRKGAVALREAKTEAERKAIQARIDKELAALKGEIR